MKTAGLAVAMSAFAFLDLAGAQELIREHLGPASGGAFGSAVASLPDLDGDGVRDYAVGDPGGGYHAGTVDVFSGATGVALFTIPGSGSGSFGAAISNAGDVDGDGIPDLLVGDPGFDDPNQAWVEEGAVRIYAGKDGSLLRERFGDHDHARRGAAVAGLDDVDGDGVADLLVDHDAISGRSEVVLYTVSDTVGDLVVGSDRDGDGIRDLLGSNDFELFAFSGASGAVIRYLLYRSGGSTSMGLIEEAPDLDGDGAREVFMGEGIGGFGGCNNRSFSVISFESGSWSTHGGYGYWLDVLPDSDGDGVDEYIASDADTCGGTWSVFSGRAGTMLYQHSGETVAWSSRPIRSVGDLNGDGMVDFIRADSYYTDLSAGQRGIVRVCSGSDLWLNADPKSVSAWQTLSLTARGVPAGNLIGIAAVDFNGTPMFQFVGLATADATEAMNLSGIVPPGLGGMTATFRSFAIGRSGSVIDSGRETISFQ